MKRRILLTVIVGSVLPLSSALAFSQLGSLREWPSPALLQAPILQEEPRVAITDLGLLEEGDLISALLSGDHDVFINNEHGYKRLFLNPTIFLFYGHLGGFQDVKMVSPGVRDSFITSGLFRNCEIDDPRVFGLTVQGEDVGTLHWVDTSGEQAVADDPDFFKKVFCINQNEFDWYPKAQKFASVSDLPRYAKGETTLLDPTSLVSLATPTPTPTPIPAGGGGGGGGAVGGGVQATGWAPSDDCPGGGGLVPGLVTCFMPEDLVGSVWNLVDDSTGEVLNETVCSLVVCGRLGLFRVLLDYPSGATFIQSPFDVGYSGSYFTNGVWQTNSGGVVQPGSYTITE